ncbi:MAG: acyl-CoA reductase [Bacteroidales bacterium]
MCNAEIKQLIHYYIGKPEQLTSGRPNKSFSVFHPEAIAFVSALSNSIKVDPVAALYPDCMAFAFWCRENGIRQMHNQCADYLQRRGRGIALHYAPANIPLHFAYLLVISTLSGNRSIIRISGRITPQAELVLNHIKAALSNRSSTFIDSIVICSFEHNKEINDWLGSMANARTIWGGDSTIKQIGQSEISPGGVDISFAHRHSVCVINASALLRSNDLSVLAQRFYADNFTFDQKSCSSASLVMWIGNSAETEKARSIFWPLVEAIAERNDPFEPTKALAKLETMCLVASKTESSAFLFRNNLVTRVQLDRLTTEQFNCNYGFFLEYQTEQIEDLVQVCDEKLQTITTFGINSEELHTLLTNHSVPGVDRITTIGRALEFSSQWDGADLIELLSKKRTFSTTSL